MCPAPPRKTSQRPYFAGPIFRSSSLLFVALFSLALAACGGNAAGPEPNPSVGVQSGGAIPNYVPPVYSSADWPQFRRDDQRTGYNPNQMLITKANVATLAPKWISDTPGGMFASPAIANGSIYKADLGGHILGLSEATGATKWMFNPVQDSFYGTPAYSQGVIYEGSIKGSFYAIDAASGALKIKYPFSIANASFESSATIAGGAVYEGVTNFDEDNNSCITSDQFVAFSPQSPQIINALTLTPPGYNGASVWSSPMIDPKGYAYLATGNTCSGPQLKAADAIIKVGPALMKVNWDQQGPPDAHDLDYGATPVYVNGMVVDGAKDGIVRAYVTATGAQAWATNAGINDGSIIGSPATDGTHIFVPYVIAPTGGAIVALNLDGSVAWTLPTGVDQYGFGVLSAPAVSQGLVFVGYYESGCTTAPCNGISALDANTGQVLWRYKTVHSIYAGPAIVDGGMFVGEFDGTSLYCFTPNGV